MEAQHKPIKTGALRIERLEPQTRLYPELWAALVFNLPDSTLAEAVGTVVTCSNAQNYRQPIGGCLGLPVDSPVRLSWLPLLVARLR